jgi:hypothetical protein
MTAPRPAGISMRDLLASCAAAKAVSRPPAVVAVGQRPATTAQQPPDGGPRPARRAA